jgi:hypothetical protein
MGGYNFISWAALEAALLQRLQDTSGQFTTPAEAAVYIQEALRVLNAQTSAGTSGQWAVDYVVDWTIGDTWQSLNVPGSPRQRTVTDVDVETQMEYMLLEPPSGGTWTGTSQFNITNLSNALQYRRDELLQATGAYPFRTTLFAAANMQRTLLPDSTLDVRRVRWLPDSSIAGSPSPYALGRDDITSADAYGQALSIKPGSPDSWRITSNSPLAFDVSCPPNLPGYWDMILLQSGTPLIPPTANVLGLPNDWCWVAMYGALADALANAPEGTDSHREKYCRMRYERGMKAMAQLPWLMSATVNGLSVGTPSFKEMDAWAQNWEQQWWYDDPQIVTGGMDLVALAPFIGAPGTGYGEGGFGGGGYGGGSAATMSSVLTVVGNAPVDQTQPVQLSRDAVDAVLAYAQHVATFKRGGAAFEATMPLLKQFEDYCAAQNHRYAALGIFRTEMEQEGDRAEYLDPRFGPKKGAR